MKKVLFILISIVLLISQETVGYSNPDQISIIKEFEIPTYQYTTLNIGGSLGAEKVSRVSVYNIPHMPSYSFEIRQNIETYQAFANSSYMYDSDQLFYSLKLSTKIGSYKSNNSDDSYNKNSDFAYNINLETRYYLMNESIFLYGQINHLENFHEDEDKYSSSYKESEEYNNLFSDFTLGLGYGKIRNVNHVLRAIRLSERMKAIGEEELSNEQIIKVANELGKLGAINKTFDRPKKEIWKNIFNVLDINVDAIEPFNLFYLDEIFSENFGERLEGFRGTFTYFNTYQGYEHIDDDGEKYYSSNKGETLNGNIEYYDNLTLNSQVSVGISYTSIIPQFEIEDYSNSITTPSLGYLYTITDRLHFNNNVFYSMLNESFGSQEIKQSYFELESSLNYYIENTLSLGVTFNYTENFFESNTTRLNKEINFTINYSLLSTYQ